MKKQYQKYLGLLLLILIVSLFGLNYVNSQIVDPRLSKSGVFTVNITVSDPDGCGGTVTPSGSQAVFAGSSLDITVNPKGCEWTYSDSRGGSGTGSSGVKIMTICQDITATFTFKKKPQPLPIITPAQQGVQLIKDGTVIVMPLDPTILFPPVSACKTAGGACSSQSDCCSGYFCSASQCWPCLSPMSTCTDGYECCSGICSGYCL